MSGYLDTRWLWPHQSRSDGSLGMNHSWNGIPLLDEPLPSFLLFLFHRLKQKLRCLPEMPRSFA